jgi:regulator of replication initiation timing
MTDPTIIATSVFASFNHVTNLVKAIFETRDSIVGQEQQNALLAQIATIQNNYLSLFQKNTSLQEEIANLKKEISQFETWNTQKNRYKLYSPWDSAVVYAITEAASNGEPPHWICTQCYENHKRSFLHPRHGKTGHEEFFCQCGAIVPSRHRGYHKIEYHRTL